MNRGKKIVLVSHCILNQNSVVKPYGRKAEDFKKLLMRLIEENIGIIQLPCPEISMYGLKRWGHVKDQFETPHFRNESRLMLENTLNNIIDYKNNSYEILGVIGIKGSPSCGVNTTCRGNWSGSLSCNNIEENLKNIKEVNEAGVFMEVLEKSLIRIDLHLNFYDDFIEFEKKL